jgi:hypothetical protein
MLLPDVHLHFALLQGEGGRTRGPLRPWSACPYLQTGPWPLRLQLFEQQSVFVVQEEPDGKHPASVVVVVLVVAVVVDDVVVVGAVVVLIEVEDVVVLVVVLVVVVLLVVVVVPVAAPSKAPMSQRGPTGRATPRWSVASQARPPLPGTSGLPESLAGLPGCGMRVWVGPPLSARGPSSGSTPRRSVPDIWHVSLASRL